MWISVSRHGNNIVIAYKQRSDARTAPTTVSLTLEQAAALQSFLGMAQKADTFSIQLSTDAEAK